MSLEVGDIVYVLKPNGERAGKGKLININYYREPHMSHVVMADFYHEDYLFLHPTQLEKINEGDE